MNITNEFNINENEDINEEFSFKCEIRHCKQCNFPLFIDTMVKEQNEKTLCRSCQFSKAQNIRENYKK